MKRSPLRQVSKKRAKQLRSYSALRKNFLADHPFCQVVGCKPRYSTQIHHRSHREGKRLNDVDNFVAVCDNCHNEIHQNPKWAREQGLLR